MRGGKIIPGGMGGIFKTKELKCTDFVQRKNKPGAVLKSPAVRILALIYRGLRLVVEEDGEEHILCQNPCPDL